MSARLGILTACLLWLCAPAIADDQPWATGVSDDRKRDAQTRLEQGNKQFLAKDYKAALATYEKAIEVWDHPAIRFNIVRTLIQLDRPIEAFDHLERALKYGAAPLEEAVYTEAVAYQKLLAGRIAQLSIKCDQKGVEITLDGKPLGTCPLAQTRRLDPGQHQIVGRLAGYQTQTRDVIVNGGKREDIAIALDRGADRMVVVHRWPTWIPWVVFAGGFAVAGIGGLLDLKAAADLNTFENAVASNCIDRACRDGENGVRFSDRDAAHDLSNAAVAIMAVGFATVATGAVMIYLNRGKAVAEKRPRMVRVNPMPGGGTVGVAGSF
jgi:tetratricopeptide (TPR) repeat protein